ncbi:AIPR family protein [Rhodovulum tesquicola]|uniref:AIPR family protein n=1 Tax=Rhodovulum tesquicola TaxID=540254 RepID=UPI002096E87E|nr:AIPR family protein [Rhodovulum tesquicola]MCO8146155.1 AIPR family protein [Rhodovulum tesquicola]
MAVSKRFDTEGFARLNERIDALVERNLVPEKNRALIYMFLTHRFYREKQEIDECFTDGPNDCGVDAVFIDRRADEPVVHIFQSKVFDSLRKASNPFPAASLEKLVRFFGILKDRKVELQKVANVQLEQKILEIRDAVDREFPTFKVWLLSNGCRALEHEVRTSRRHLEAEGIIVEEFHLDEVIEFCLNSHSSRANHTFHARDVGVLEYGTSELQSFVGYISALQLYRLLHDLRDEKRIDYSVFNMNVRGFLGLDNPINKEIFRTAASSDNIYFSALNNGLTIVGSKCRVMRTGSDMPKIGIKNMSIVNGAQTCSAIFDAMKDYYPDVRKFEKLSVLFRIFETEDPELIGRIAVSSNNQNRINPRDLRANDDEQVMLERELAKFGIRYQRKRGFDYDPDDGRRSIDALKVGQILLSFVHHDPARAKRDSDSIFSELYQSVFGNVSVETLFEAIQWYDLIEGRKRYIQDEIRIRGVRRAENNFVTYGVFHILMLCSLLGAGVEEGKREGVIDDAIAMIAQHLQEAGEPAYYSFFRDPRQTDKLRSAANQPLLI